MVAQIDSEYRRHGLGRTARRLVSYGLFEGRPATTQGQWFNPAVFGWLRTLNAIGGRPRVDRPIFITGLGRSGTTILGLLLSLHRDVGFLNEPKALWHVVDPRQDVNGNYGGATPRYRLGAEDVSAEISLRAQRLFGRYLQVVGGQRVVDKYPELVFRIPYVRAIFPDARFVFIHRNGVDACQSIVQWSKRLGRESPQGLEDWWGRNDSKWLCFWRELILGEPQTYGEIAHLDPAGIDHANRAALEWIVTMREGLAACDRHGDAVVPVCYETLLAEPADELSRLLLSLGLGAEPAIYDYAAKRLHDNRAKQAPVLLPVVQRWFDGTMAALGYRAVEAPALLRPHG